jgi:hypothetical protein
VNVKNIDVLPDDNKKNLKPYEPATEKPEVLKTRTYAKNKE